MPKNTLSEIEKLLSVIKESGLAEVSLEVEGIKLQVRRDTKIKLSPIGTSPESIAIPSAQPTPPAPSLSSTTTDTSTTIKAPMVGTFYISQKPGSPPFVKVGQEVQVGQTLCIIEAMKLFNEIEAEQSGTITEILVENGTPVEYEQPLFRIQPS